MSQAVSLKRAIVQLRDTTSQEKQRVAVVGAGAAVPQRGRDPALGNTGVPELLVATGAESDRGDQPCYGGVIDAAFRGPFLGHCCAAPYFAPGALKTTPYSWTRGATR